MELQKKIGFLIIILGVFLIGMAIGSSVIYIPGGYIPEIEEESKEVSFPTSDGLELFVEKKEQHRLYEVPKDVIESFRYKDSISNINDSVKDIVIRNTLKHMMKSVDYAKDSLVTVTYVVDSNKVIKRDYYVRVTFKPNVVIKPIDRNIITRTYGK